MSARPRWATAIWEFATDTVLDPRHGWPNDDTADADHDRIIDALNTALCDLYGHEIIDDHCGKPEHRYCAWCGKREGTS